MTISSPAPLSMTSRVTRALLGLAVMVTVLLMPTMPAWLAILATYPVFTAAFGEDMIRALFAASGPQTMGDVSSKRRPSDQQALGVT